VIETRHDAPRRCGRRKAGGLYLMGAGLAEPCRRLPIPLLRCPTCDAGVKFSRGWTWVDGAALLETRACLNESERDCLLCPLAEAALAGQRSVGLLWVGAEHYPSPGDFDQEALELGISRRVRTLPHGFVVGETWVWLAHVHCIPTEDAWIPGVFSVFRPRAVEYVVKGDEDEAELQKLTDRGITPVRVVPIEEKEKEHGR
jgi:hypothetical protein